jgi:RNA-binding protein Musashi
MSAFGEIDACTIMRDPTGRSRGFAFLTYNDPASVTKVMSQGHQLDGKQVSHQPFYGGYTDGMSDPLLLFSYHDFLTVLFPCPTPLLMTETTPSSMAGCLLFRCFGFQIDPKRAIPRAEHERTAKVFVGGLAATVTKGFAFATFANEESVDQAMIASGSELEGKPV